MRIERRRKQRAAGITGLFWMLVLITPAVLGQTAENAPQVSTVTLDIGHRMHPDFQERVQTKMNQRQQVGDSDWFFEVVGFYPQFAYVDSSKTVISLSDEPKNPAFKIRVYENDKFVEDAWAFYAINVPHFSPKSFLTFQATQFEYRGKTYKDNSARKSDAH